MLLAAPFWRRHARICRRASVQQVPATPADVAQPGGKNIGALKLALAKLATAPFWR